MSISQGWRTNIALHYFKSNAVIVTYLIEPKSDIFPPVLWYNMYTDLTVQIRNNTECGDYLGCQIFVVTFAVRSQMYVCTRWIFKLCIYGVAVLYKVNLWTLNLWCGSIVQGESLNFVFVVWQFCTRWIFELCICGVAVCTRWIFELWICDVAVLYKVNL